VKAHIDNPESTEVGTREGTPVRISIWLVLIAIVFTVIAAYQIYAGGNYSGSRFVLSEQPIGQSLGWVPLTGLFLSLLVINPVSYILSKKKLLSSKKIVLLFAMLVAGASAVSRGAALALLSLIGLAQESITNPMAFQPLLERFSPLVIPFGGATFSDREMEAFMGIMSGQSSVPWDIWLMPCILWGLFVLAFFVMGIGLATIVRQRWTEVEHLRYPVVNLAIEMMAEDDDTSLLGPLWRNKLTWIGFIPGFLFMAYTQFQSWFPGLPQLQVGYGNWLIFRPLYDALRGTTLGIITQPSAGFAMNYWGISPMWLGVAYLIPPHGTLVSYIISHLIRIIPNYIFYSTGRMNTFTYTVRNMWGIFSYGAVFGLGIFMLYILRNDLRQMFRIAFRPGKSSGELDDSDEAIPYRTAIFFILGSAIFIMFYVVAFLNYKIWMALLYIVMYIPIILGTARMRAYAATMWGRNFGSYDMGVQTTLLPGLFGQKAYGITGLTAAAILGEFDICERHMTTINLLECWKLADEQKVSKKTVTKAMTLLFTIGTGIFFYTALNYLYKGYGVSMAPRNSYTWRLIRPLAPLTYQGAQLKGPRGDVAAFFITGMLLLWFNSWMRIRYIWWPIEPVGFAWGSRYDYEEIGNFIIMGIIKSLIVRYGGTALYNKLRPLFLGMIMGWAAANVATNAINVIMAF
jgi:hypothetical protein